MILTNTEKLLLKNTFAIIDKVRDTYSKLSIARNNFKEHPNDSIYHDQIIAYQERLYSLYDEIDLMQIIIFANEEEDDE